MLKFWLNIFVIVVVSFLDMRFQCNGYLTISYMVGVSFILSRGSFYHLKVGRSSNFEVFLLYSLFIVFFGFFYSIFLITINPILTTESLGVFDYLKYLIIFPVVEEVLFRGVLLHYLYKKTGAIKAVIFCSIGFSLAHILTDTGFIYPFLFSLVACHIYRKTGNISDTIIAHIVNNIVAFIVFPNLLFHYSEKLNELKFTFLAVFALLSIISLTVLIRATNKK